ncbi:hypothetical protein D3C76_1342540 [compost metagenome]
MFMLHVAFDIGRTEQMTGALQTDAASDTGALDQGMPLLERQGHDKVADVIEVPRHVGGFAADA